MRILLDMGVSPKARQPLQDAGFETEHLHDLGLGQLDDEDIISRALERGQVIATYDRDFIMIAARTAQTLPSIIHLRLDKTTVPEMISLLKQAARQFESQLMNGAIVTVLPHRIKCRMLPIHWDEE